MAANENVPAGARETLLGDRELRRSLRNFMAGASFASAGLSVAVEVPFFAPVLIAAGYVLLPPANEH